MNIVMLAPLSIAIAMTGLWFISLKTHDVSIVDTFWGLGFFMLSILAITTHESPPTRSVLLAGVVGLWGLRLSFYLNKRNHGQPEDYRYAAMRRSWGDKFPIVSLATVFGLQGAIMLVVALPIYAATLTPHAPLSSMDAFGFAVFVIGFIFETVGDYQLSRFKALTQSRGKTFQTGLWRYTRHPNYFGDALQWWGFFLIGGAASGHLWSVVSPITMTFLLVRVSGLPLVEKRLRSSRPDFHDYMQRTSAFVPWPPKTK